MNKTNRFIGLLLISLLIAVASLGAIHLFAKNHDHSNCAICAAYLSLEFGENAYFIIPAITLSAIFQTSNGFDFSFEPHVFSEIQRAPPLPC